MQRRKFLTSAGAGLALGAAIMPGLSTAQQAALPNVKWRLTSSFPKSLDTIYGAAEVISKRVKAATGGVRHPGVFGKRNRARPLGHGCGQDGTVECCHTAPILLLRQGSHLCLFPCGAVRHECAPAKRLDVPN